MSKITLSPDASGTGTFTISSPNSNTDRTLALPDASGTLAVSGGSSFAIGDWTIEQSGTDLLFKYSGTSVFKITSAGATVAKDNVTAYGTV